MSQCLNFEFCTTIPKPHVMQLYKSLQDFLLMWTLLKKTLFVLWQWLGPLLQEEYVLDLWHNYNKEFYTISYKTLSDHIVIVVIWYMILDVIYLNRNVSPYAAWMSDVFPKIRLQSWGYSPILYFSTISHPSHHKFNQPLRKYKMWGK